MTECAQWIEENSEQFSDDWGAYHAYETLWPLYLYQKQMKVQDKASKYLNLSPSANFGAKHNPRQLNSEPVNHMCDKNAYLRSNLAHTKKLSMENHKR